MADQKPVLAPSDQKSKPTTKQTTTYISGGRMLESPPITARLSNFTDNAYNFLGLYLASLFSLDPYAAAQNSQFNTSGPGRMSNRARAGWGNTGGTGTGAGSRGTGGGSGGGSGGRRLGTMNDIRGGGGVVPGPSACGGSCG